MLQLFHYSSYYEPVRCGSRVFAQMALKALVFMLMVASITGSAPATAQNDSVRRIRDRIGRYARFQNWPIHAGLSREVKPNRR